MKNNPELTKLKKERLKRGISIRDISEQVKMSKSMYSYLESGSKRLTYEQAVKIAEELGKRPDELFLEDYEEFFKNTLI